MNNDLSDTIIAWMADHPWSVGLLLCASILFVAAIERVPGQ